MTHVSHPNSSRNGAKPIPGNLASLRAPSRGGSGIDDGKSSSVAPSAPWPSDGPVQTLPGRYSRAHFTVTGTRPNVSLQSLSLEAISERGQPLLRYTLEGTPSPKVQKALLGLLAPAHASQDVDQYLNDIRTIVQTEPTLSWKRTLPAISEAAVSVKPMQHRPMEFPEFIENPAKARDVFFCSASYRDASTTLNGEIDLNNRVAHINLIEKDSEGAMIESADYTVNPTRRDLRGASEWHAHLKTKLWEAMEMFWNKGKSSFDATFRSAPQHPAESEDLTAVPRSRLNVEQRISIHDLSPVRPTFTRTTPGGATISLEIGKRLGLFSINLKEAPGDESFATTLRARNPITGFSEPEIAELKLTANAMCSADAEMRENATRVMLGKIHSMKFGSAVNEALHATVHKFSHVLEIREDPWVQGSLCHLMVRGYQPAMVSLLKCPYIDEVSMVFPSMFIGYKRDGSLLIELISGFNQRVTFTAPAGHCFGVHESRILLHSICSTFSQQPSMSWVDIVSFLSDKVRTIPGASLSLKNSEQFSTLPPINDHSSIRAYQFAVDTLAHCMINNKDLSLECGLTYSGPGQARVFLKPYKTAATLVVSVKGSAITDISIHSQNPLTHGELRSDTLSKNPCRIGNLQTIESKNAVLTLTKLLCEAFVPPQGERETQGADLRAKLMTSRLQAALTKVGALSRHGIADSGLTAQ